MIRCHWCSGAVGADPAHAASLQQPLGMPRRTAVSLRRNFAVLAVLQRLPGVVHLDVQPPGRCGVTSGAPTEAAAARARARESFAAFKP